MSAPAAKDDRQFFYQNRAARLEVNGPSFRWAQRAVSISQKR